MLAEQEEETQSHPAKSDFGIGAELSWHEGNMSENSDTQLNGSQASAAICASRSSIPTGIKFLILIRD